MISLTETSKDWVVKLLAKAKKGSLLLTLPDNSTHHFGNLDCPPEAKVTVHDESFFKDLVLGNDIGLGESYVDGKWDADDLTRFIEWLLLNKKYFASKAPGWITHFTQRFLKGIEQLRHFKNRNSIDQSRKNIQYHYDLGNPFYESFLDPSMTYSSAFFTDQEQSLEDAQTEKYDRICRKLNLSPELHILEIGTGWGGFATHAAMNYGCKVTTTTISNRQYEFAAEKIHKLGLNDQVTLVKKDYRTLEGQYDRIVSIEMIEAVGHKYLGEYFKTCYRLLKPNGLAAFQAILSSNSHYQSYRNGVDWIRKHIFPGGHLPSQNAINQTLEKVGIPWDVYHNETFALHYARTLREWQSEYNKNHKRLSELGVTETFNRKWNFYLSYCEAGFLTRHVNVAQLVFGRPDIDTFNFEESSPSLQIAKASTNTKPQMAS